MLEDQKMLKRITVLAVMALILACFVSGISYGGEKEPMHLVMWWWGEQDTAGLENWLKDSIEKYEKIKPYVKVEEILQGTDECIPAFHAAVAAQEGPDIANLWYGGYWLPDVWAGNVEPLNKYISEEECKHWLGLQTVSWKGKIWGVPMYSYAMVAGYRKDLFRKVGLDPENPPTAWAGFLRTCDQLKQAGITPIETGLKDGWLGVVLPNYFMSQIASVKEILEAAVGKHSFTDDKFLDHWQRIEELKARGYFNEDIGSLDWFSGNQEWLAGKGAIAVFASGALIAALKEYGSDTIGLLPCPALKGERFEGYTTESMVNFVTPWSPNKQEAADFLVYLHTPNRSQALYEFAGGGPLPADDRFDISSVQEPMVRKVYQSIANGFKKNLRFTDAILPWGILGDGMMPALQLMWSKDLSAKEAAEMTEKAAANWRKLNPELIQNYETWIKELAGSQK